MRPTRKLRKGEAGLLQLCMEEIIGCAAELRDETTLPITNILALTLAEWVSRQGCASCRLEDLEMVRRIIEANRNCPPPTTDCKPRPSETPLQ